MGVQSKLKELINDYQASYQQEGIEIQLKDDGVRGLKVHGCSQSLAQVMANLISNSRDAIRESKIAAGKIAVTLTANSSEIIVAIKDDGPGVPEDIRPKIFGAYFTTKALGHGTGLGLCISDQIIKAHGGTMACLPSDSGAWFQIKLPRPLETQMLI